MWGRPPCFLRFCLTLSGEGGKQRHRLPGFFRPANRGEAQHDFGVWKQPMFSISLLLQPFYLIVRVNWSKAPESSFGRCKPSWSAPAPAGGPFPWRRGLLQVFLLINMGTLVQMTGLQAWTPDWRWLIKTDWILALEWLELLRARFEAVQSCFVVGHASWK